jgi:hypothetical protein
MEEWPERYAVSKAGIPEDLRQQADFRDTEERDDE